MNYIILNFFSILIFMTGIFWLYSKIIKLNNKNGDFNRNIELQKQNYQLNQKKKCKINNIFKSIGSLFPILFIVCIIRCFFYEPFYIPSESMLPNLLPGDYIIVKKFFYGIKNPFTGNIIIKYHDFKRGDIIVFKNPNNPYQNYIKRIIGIPGDKIIYDPINKIITIYENYNNINKRKIIFKHYVFNKYNTNAIENTNIKKNIEDIKKINNNCNILNHHSMIYQEVLDNHKYNILISHKDKSNIQEYYKQKNQSSAIWIIPPKQYFVLGDNRDNSLDSRYWGFVPEKNILGKADYIWMNLERNENKWPIGINLNRIGKIY